MITLTGGGIQNGFGLFVPYGYINFQLNMDARIVAAPGGQVPAALVITFQFDLDGNLIQPAKLYSNAELSPQLPGGLLGTYYLVTVYDQNGARLTKDPMWWIFPEPADATVDISQMTAYAVNV